MTSSNAAPNSCSLFANLDGSCTKGVLDPTNIEPTSVLDLTTLSPASSPGTSPHRFFGLGLGSSSCPNSLHKSIVQKAYHTQTSLKLNGDMTLPFSEFQSRSSTTSNDYSSYSYVKMDCDSGDSMLTRSISDTEVLSGIDMLEELDAQLDFNFVMKSESNLGEVFSNSPTAAGDNLWDETVMNALDTDGLFEVNSSLPSHESRVVSFKSEACENTVCHPMDGNLEGFGDKLLSLNEYSEKQIDACSKPGYYYDRNPPYQYDDDHHLYAQMAKAGSSFPEFISCSTRTGASPVQYNYDDCDDYDYHNLRSSPSKNSSFQQPPSEQGRQIYTPELMTDAYRSGIPAGSRSPRSTLIDPTGGMPRVGFTSTCGSDKGTNGMVFEKHEEKGLRLVHLLLGCAEMVAEQQYDVVQPLLSRLQILSSPHGDPMERIAFYFSDMLVTRIAGDLRGLDAITNGLDFDGADIQMETDKSYLALYQALPYTKFLHFAANQAILEAVADSPQLHVIDFEIKQGIQWPNLLQSLAVRPGGRPKLVKMSAVGSCMTKLNQTGKILTEFAESLQLNFVFYPIMVKSFKDLEEGLFPVSPEEVLAVNFPAILQSPLWDDVTVETLLSLVRKLHPKVFTIIEAERHNDSSSFVHRFIEVLFYYSALFDSLEVSLDRRSLDRVRIERVLLRSGLRNIMSACGVEELARHPGIDKWQSVLPRAGFHAIPFSEHALYQAKLLLRLYTSDAFKMADNGCALTIGWKETPLFAVLAAICGGND